MDSIKRSFKSHGSYNRHRSTSSSGGAVDANNQEEQPILFDHEEDSHPSASAADRNEVVVKIDGNNNNNGIWRESSYDFWKDETGGAATVSGKFSFKRSSSPEDPPTKLIEKFLHKQKATGGEIALDLDLEMDELRRGEAAAKNSKELRVSFQPPNDHVEVHPDSIHRRRHKSNNKNGSSDSDSDSDYDSDNRGSGGGTPAAAEVLLCTSNSFQRNPSLLRAKTRSRLMDPPPPMAGSGGVVDDERKSRAMKSGQQMRSGMLGKIHDEDDEDPFMDEDLPVELTKANYGTLTILQWVSLVVILAAFSCSLFIPALEKQSVWGLHLWKWELLILVLICGRLVSGWGIRIVVFFIERNFLLRKRLLYFVYGVRKAVQNCLWLGLVLLCWHYIFDDKVEKETHSTILSYVTKVLVCLLVATLFRLVKTLFVKSLASSFHVSTYFDRIQESLFNQFVIETLSGPPLIEIQNTREEEERTMVEVQKFQNAGATIPADLRAAALPAKSTRVIGSGPMQRSSRVLGGKSVRVSGSVSKKDFSGKQGSEEGITIDHLHKLNQKNVSAWNMKRLMNIVRHGTLSTLDERIMDAKHGQDESATQIQSEYEAKAAAKKIFTNVAKPGSKYIYLADLMRFMREDEALKTLTLFEGAQENKRISRSALKNWVVNAFRERRALSLTLNDTKTAVNKLHHMVNMVVSIVVLVIWLLILGIATTHLLVFISSQLLLVVFIFGNTCKMIFEAIIFLFVMHPFDVGDRCEVDGVQMIVEEMNILTTVFLRYDNQKIAYPNSVLSTKPISNFYRSPDMGDAIDFNIHVSTPVEKVAKVKERIKAFIESKKEHWYPNPTVIIKDVEDMNKLKMAVWLQHRMNHQNMGERWTRRELVVQEMIKVFRELDIDYRMMPLDVNVRDMPALSSNRYPSTWTTCS